MVVFEVKAVPPKTCPALGVESLPANTPVSGPGSVCIQGLGGDRSSIDVEKHLIKLNSHY